MTFTFGAGLPILFPIAGLNLLSIYLLNLLSLAYSYRRIEDQDDKKVRLFFLKIVIVAPLFYILMATWLLSSPQVFDKGRVLPNDTGNVFGSSGHTCLDIMSHPSKFGFVMIPIWALFAVDILLCDILSCCEKAATV